MTWSDVQFRISQIQSIAAAAGGYPVTATRAAAPTGGTGRASATEFAAALDAAVGAERATAAATPTGWVAPTHGRVSSEYGHRWGKHHDGIDIAAGAGTPVKAAAGGVVRRASWYGGYGNAVIIDHGNGVSTLYAHNSKLNVEPGDRVRAGQVIAKVGSTGDSTGPHLHFEVEVKGKKVDPRPWLKARGVTL